MGKEIWRQFESRVVSDCRIKGITAIKIPEKFFGVYGPGKPKQQKTSFDFCFGIDGLAAFADAKTIGDGTFNFKRDVLNPKKAHQFKALSEAHDNLNIAGYLFWFYERGEIVWASIPIVKQLMEAGHNSITVDSPGLQKQRDDTVIDLRKLLSHDIDRLLKLLWNES